MIYFWHSDNGVLFKKETAGREEFGETVAKIITCEKPVLLSPGIYPLTSVAIDSDFHQHKIVVRTDGRGLLVTQPIRFHEERVNGDILFLPQGGIRERKILILPEHSPYGMVIMQDKEPDMARIIDLVYHYPEEPDVVLSEVSFFLN
ncbi:MAG: hypothetical protein Q8P55_02940 [bacterium]|nr:hypothetical protein [bacterium]